MIMLMLVNVKGGDRIKMALVRPLVVGKAFSAREEDGTSF
jgi:hypothetical protein